jgi:hypothetical protein
MSPGDERSRSAGNGPAKESLTTTDTILTPSDPPCIFPRRRLGTPSDYLRLLRPRAEHKASRRRSASVQTALDVGGSSANVVRIEVGEKFTAWVTPASIIDDLIRLDIACQRDHARRMWAFPKAKLSELLAALDADGRKVELVEVPG